MPCLKPRLDLKNHLHGLLQIFDVDLAPSASWKSDENDKKKQPPQCYNYQSGKRLVMIHLGHPSLLEADMSRGTAFTCPTSDFKAHPAAAKRGKPSCWSLRTTMFHLLFPQKQRVFNMAGIERQTARKANTKTSWHGTLRATPSENAQANSL